MTLPEATGDPVGEGRGQEGAQRSGGTVLPPPGPAITVSCYQMSNVKLQVCRVTQRPQHLLYLAPSAFTTHAQFQTRSQAWSPAAEPEGQDHYATRAAGVLSRPSARPG